MKNINQIIRGLPRERRAKVSARAKNLIGEEMALQHVRRALDLTQAQMAKLLGIGQDSVSRIESRSDMLISTLQSYVEGCAFRHRGRANQSGEKADAAKKANGVAQEVKAGSR